LILALALGPVLIMVRLAFTPKINLRDVPIDWALPLDFSSFGQVIESEILRSILNSLLVATATTIIVLLLSALAGHVLARYGGKRRDDFLMLVLGTRMGPAVIFAIPIYLIAVRAGLVDTPFSIIAIYVVYNLAFGIWLLHGFFLEVPKEIEEAALIDGLNEWQVLIRITIPSAISGVIATAVLVFIMTWNEFFFAFVLTQRNMGTFPTRVPSFFGAFEVEWGLMFAANSLGMLVPVVFGILARKWLAKGFAGGLVD
jgi:multiple sugar transport system permease protein